MEEKSIVAQVVACDLLRGNPMYRVIICDDDPLLLEAVKEEVTHIFEKEKLRVKIHTYKDPTHISEQLLSSCDIALLDIDFENDGFNGMDLARKIRHFRKDSIIIFITNFIEYAPEGYEVQAFRYVLKREMSIDLKDYIFKAIDQLKSVRETLKIQVNGEIIDLLLERILYLEVQQHDVTIYCQKSSNNIKGEIKEYHVHISLSALETQLEPHGFLRIHKSFLVNMRHVSKLQCREALLDNGIKLRVSEKNYAEQKRRYLLWKGWQ